VHRTLLRAPLLILALAANPAILSAQGGPPTPPSAEAAAAMRDMQTWYTELQEIGQRLAGVQQQVMQDVALRTRQEGIARAMKEAMLRADPTLEAMEARAGVLEVEARQAQQSGDQARLMQLAQEAQQIQARVMAAQQQALQSGDLAARVQAFEKDVRARMAQVDPQSPMLIERAEALQTRIQETMRRQQGQGR
jgi:hypothetical protein